MALTGIQRIDDLFNNVPGTQPIIPGDPDKPSVGVIQDLLAGHGFKKMPNPRSSSYGTFGPNTKSALLDFRSTKLGLDDPDDVKADSQTLLKLAQEPAIAPVASQAYLTLALDFLINDLLMILSLVSIVESNRQFAGLNRNTDKAGLSFGLIQWAQRPGRLFEIVNAFKTEQPVLFDATFGGAAAAKGMLAHVKKGKAGLNANGSTNDPQFDLINLPWSDRFMAASRNTLLQKVQINIALKVFKDTVDLIKGYAGDKIHTQRGFAFQIDLSNQHGDGGGKSIFKAVNAAGLTEAQLLQKIENESVRRVESQFGVGSNEAVATRDRRNFFRNTPLLADTDFQN